MSGPTPEAGARPNSPEAEKRSKQGPEKSGGARATQRIKDALKAGKQNLTKVFETFANRQKMRNPDAALDAITTGKADQVAIDSMKRALKDGEFGAMRGQKLLMELMTAEAAGKTAVVDQIRTQFGDLVDRHDKFIATLSDPAHSDGKDVAIADRIQHAVAAANAERQAIKARLGVNGDPAVAVEANSNSGDVLQQFNSAPKPKEIEARYLLALAKKIAESPRTAHYADGTTKDTLPLPQFTTKRGPDGNLEVSFDINHKLAPAEGTVIEIPESSTTPDAIDVKRRNILMHLALRGDTRFSQFVESGDVDAVAVKQDIEQSAKISQDHLTNGVSGGADDEYSRKRSDIAEMRSRSVGVLQVLARHPQGATPYETMLARQVLQEKFALAA